MKEGKLGTETHIGGVNVCMCVYVCACAVCDVTVERTGRIRSPKSSKCIYASNRIICRLPSINVRSKNISDSGLKNFELIYGINKI